MNRPPEQAPPYGALIESAREEAGLSRREAAKLAGISDSWWRYVASGWQNGPITGTAATVAAMALAVGVTPEQMETAGERPDAASVMRKESGPPSFAAALRQARAAASPAPGSPAADILAGLLSGYPDDPVIAALGAQRGKAPRVIVAEILEWLDFQGQGDGHPETGASAGLPADEPLRTGKQTVLVRNKSARFRPVRECSPYTPLCHGVDT
jgi:transcriptional regulator with XRE-family HTH domain